MTTEPVVAEVLRHAAAGDIYQDATGAQWQVRWSPFGPELMRYAAGKPAAGWLSAHVTPCVVLPGLHAIVTKRKKR